MAYSETTWQMLRNTRFGDVGTLDGKQFIRCVPTWRVAPEDRREVVLKAVAEIDEPGVLASNNPNFGGDYLRVELNTATYRRVAEMLS